MGIFEQLGINIEEPSKPKLVVSGGRYVLDGVTKLTSEQWKKVQDWIINGKPYINEEPEQKMVVNE